ncbi:hypothetical protein FACS189440_08770 [Bacteroidia bacterium]|nr:hypothetical protein FACS189423_09720 [Bacteroidia bacterium]GHT47645.1 hypothetical protein FACS189440_08770 [Bacteroidia bacterium]
MQAYEFNTVIRRGIIHIPEQYRNEKLSSVRVILLSNTSEPSAVNRKKFTAMKLKTKGFKFDREEANER